MYLFDIASRHMNWLSERQALTASNIANVDTAGYRAKTLLPFSDFETASIQMTSTSPLHFSSSEPTSSVSSQTTGPSWGSSHSQNNVSIEQELMTASTNNRQMSIDTSLVRSFQRMLLSSLKV